MIERGRMGGDCLNTGCVPSKALISSARLVEQIRHSQDWGLDAQRPAFEFERVFSRMRAQRARIAVHDSQARFEGLGVDVFRGEARFVSPGEIRVGGVTLRAKNFVIAAGSRAGAPPIEGLEQVRYYINETVFDELDGKPDRLVILGGGPIGCELGQAFARHGVGVTILQRAPQILEREDSDAAGVLRRRLESEGVTVNAHLQTSQPHIYAAGDIVGSYQFTHVADHHARVVVRNILIPWFKASVEEEVVPWCTYTSPELARVGLNEDQARKKGIEYDLFTVPLEEVDRAVVESEEVGFAKVLTAPGSDRILGVTLVCERAGDLISEFVVAMKNGIGLKGIVSAIHPYPTFAEVARKLGDQQQKSRLTPFARRVFAWLYRRRRQ